MYCIENIFKKGNLQSKVNVYKKSPLISGAFNSVVQKQALMVEDSFFKMENPERFGLNPNPAYLHLSVHEPAKPS
jgi:hypothetical protein